MDYCTEPDVSCQQTLVLVYNGVHCFTAYIIELRERKKDSIYCITLRRVSHLTFLNHCRFYM